MHNIYSLENVFYIYDRFDDKTILIGSRDELIDTLILNESNMENYLSSYTEKFNRLFSANGYDFIIKSRSTKELVFNEEKQEFYDKVTVFYYKEYKRYVILDGYSRIINPNIFKEEINIRKKIPSSRYYRINKLNNRRHRRPYNIHNNRRNRHHTHSFKYGYYYSKQNNNNFENGSSEKLSNPQKTESYYHSGRYSSGWKHNKKSMKQWGKNSDNTKSIKKYFLEEIEDNFSLLEEDWDSTWGTIPMNTIDCDWVRD